MTEDANDVVASDLPTANLDDGTRLTDAATIQNNIIKTALAYKLTGNTTYLNRAIDEMTNAASFADWNPKKHFLDTSAIMTGMAIGYDWLYNDLNNTQKTTIATAIYDKGVAKAYQQHQSPYCNFNWRDNKTNWNFVCNSASIIAALSVADVSNYKSTASELVSLSLRSMQGAILKFGNDGSWYESPEYGRYGMSYYYPATEAMRTALGTDYRYGSNPRTNAFCDYIIHITGGRGVFNYGDYGDDALVGFPGLFLNSKRTGNEKYSTYRTKQLISTTATVWDVLWYTAPSGNFNLEAVAADRLFKSNETVTFRNGFFNDKLVFVGLHGGYNADTHCQLDAGSFVYDAYGMRFACDEGAQNYNVAGIWTVSENSSPNRWSYYRNRAESHNTLVINPDSKADQNPYAQSEITNFKTENDYGFAVVDLTDAYKDDVTSAQRGVWFNRAKGSLLVQDEINLKKASDVYWNMTFVKGAQGASYKLAADGKSVIITREAKKIWVGIADGDGTFEVVNASPMSTSPNPSGNTVDSNWYGKLQLKLSGVSGSQRIAVYIIPVASDYAKPSIPALTDIANWE